MKKSITTSTKPYIVNAYKCWLEDNDFGVIAKVFTENTNAKIHPSLIDLNQGYAEIDISFDSVSDFEFCGEFFTFYKIIDGIDKFLFIIPCDLIMELNARGSEIVNSKPISFPYLEFIENYILIESKPRLQIVK